MAVVRIDRTGARAQSAFSTGEWQTMTLTELARVLGISRTSCYEYARRKELPVPVVRIGRCLLVS